MISTQNSLVRFLAGSEGQGRLEVVNNNYVNLKSPLGDLWV